MDKKEIERIVKEAFSLGRNTLAEPDAMEVLRLNSIPVPDFSVVKDVSAAIETAEKIGFPVVLKLVSPDLIHKSDVGGVAVGLKDGKDLESRWAQMILDVAFRNPSAMIEGFIIEKMAPKGVEVIVGGIKDEQFGPVVMFGAGGVAAELMRDVSFRLAPIDRDEAFEMMSETKGFPLLTGYRGDTVKDLNAVADVIIKLSGILEETDGIREIEINPLLVYDKGVLAVDARAILGFPG